MPWSARWLSRCSFARGGARRTCRPWCVVGELTTVEMALEIEMAREMRRLLDSPGPAASEADVTPAVAAVERLRLPGGCVPASASA